MPVVAVILVLALVTGIVFALVAIVAPEQLRNTTGAGARKHYRHRAAQYPDSQALPGDANYSPSYREDVYGE